MLEALTNLKPKFIAAHTSHDGRPCPDCWAWYRPGLSAGSETLNTGWFNCLPEDILGDVPSSGIGWAGYLTLNEAYTAAEEAWKKWQKKQVDEIVISLATADNLEDMRLLRNENRWAYFRTEEITPEQQIQWWLRRDLSVKYFVGRMEGRHCWQFSLSADGVLGNLAVSDWCKGRGVAKRCVARVLQPGTRYWGLFRVDNPMIIRFWPDGIGFPEPTFDPPYDKPRDGHPYGSVQWVDYVWTEVDVKRHGVQTWRE
jgi:hypothetical protein